MLTYKRVLKITYGLIVAGVAAMIILLWTGGSFNGISGQFTALAISGLLLLYSGVHITRLLKIMDDEVTYKECMSNLITNDLEKYYMKLKVCQKNISYVRHDIANHMQLINNMRESLECDCYKEQLSKINEELERISTIKYCDNMLLDIAIEQKLSELKARDITVNTDIILRGISECECENLCVILWATVDKMSESLSPKDTIDIKINSNDSCVVNVSISTRIKPNDTHLLKRIVENAGGSLLVEKSSDKYYMIMMLEVKTYE